MLVQYYLSRTIPIKCVFVFRGNIPNHRDLTYLSLQYVEQVITGVLKTFIHM